MDEAKQEIKATFDNRLINHYFLSYIPKADFADIEKRISKGTSAVVGFHVGEEIKFVAVFDFHSDCLHVRDVGGFFPRLTKVLDTFAQGLAQFTEKKFISFKTEKRAVAKWADVQGYTYSSEMNEYRKALH